MKTISCLTFCVLSVVVCGVSNGQDPTTNDKILPRDQLTAAGIVMKLNFARSCLNGNDLGVAVDTKVLSELKDSLILEAETFSDSFRGKIMRQQAIDLVTLTHLFYTTRIPIKNADTVRIFETHGIDKSFPDASKMNRVVSSSIANYLKSCKLPVFLAQPVTSRTKSTPSIGGTRKE